MQNGLADMLSVEFDMLQEKNGISVGDLVVGPTMNLQPHTECIGVISSIYEASGNGSHDCVVRPLVHIIRRADGLPCMAMQSGGQDFGWTEKMRKI